MSLSLCAHQGKIAKHLTSLAHTRCGDHLQQVQIDYAQGAVILVSNQQKGVVRAEAAIHRLIADVQSGQRCEFTVQQRDHRLAIANHRQQRTVDIETDDLYALMMKIQGQRAAQKMAVAIDNIQRRAISGGGHKVGMTG